MRQLRKLYPYIRPNLGLLAASLGLLVASGLLEGLTTMLLAPIFDSVLTSSGQLAGPAPKFSFLNRWLGLTADNLLIRVALFLVLFSFLKGLLLYLAEYLMGYSGQKVVMELRNDVYDHLLHQSARYYSDSSTGQLMARILTDTERLQESVSKTVTDYFRQIILMAVFLGLIFWADWKLALLSLLITPLILWITASLGRKMRRHSGRSQASLADISTILQETITGIRIVKAFGMERFENSRFRQATRQLMRANLKSTRVGAMNSPLIEFIGYVAFVPFLIYAHFNIRSSEVTLGAFVVFIFALFRLYEPVRKLSKMHLHFQQSFASSARIFELLEAPHETVDESGAVELAPVVSGVAFRDVWLGHEGQMCEAVLRGFDLEVRAGEIVALVGSSGAGKTSLVNLIPRFFDVDSGRVEFDGRDIRTVTLVSLRRQIAMVTQETFLFNDTICNNIAYGREDFSQEELHAAARAALIHDFIAQLPEGYDTLVGERGQRLSGGQRQRLAIARALMKNAPILILDEATSSLDSESEKLVQQALANLMQGRTTFVIAHRLSTIRRADKIVVMDDGQIRDTGTHEELLARPGIYRKLYQLQFADEEGVTP
ncbi:MAG: ABC transporter ATP-binding protein [Acidobacteriota bacterium]